MRETLDEDALGPMLVDVARLLRRDFDRRGQGLGLTQAQWRVIAFLSRRPGVNQATISEALEVQPITLARLIDRMVVAGWVERRPDPADRRAFRLILTDRVAPLRQRMHELGRETMASATAGMSDDEVAALTAMLGIIKRNLQGVEPVAAERRVEHG